MKPPIFLFILACLFPGPLLGNPHPVSLTFEHSAATIVGTNLANKSSDTIEYSLSGTMLAEVGLDSISGKPTSFQFTGGRMHFSDFDATGVLVVLPVTMEARGLSAVPSSYDPANSIDPETGILNATNHYLELDQGTLVFTNVLGFETARRDYSETSLLRNFSEVMTVTSDLLESNSLGKRYLITFSQDDEIDDLFPVTSTITIGLQGRSQSVATGEISVISDSAKEWASETADLQFESPNALHPDSGHPLAILYALGLRADKSPGLTISEDASQCLLSLPESGTRLPVTIQYSHDLSDGSWQKITADAAIPVGTSGDLTFPLPGGSSTFVRLKVESL